MPNNMAHMFLDGVAGHGLMLLVHTDKAPSDSEWTQYFTELRKHDPTKIKNLAFTDGGAPSGPQRKMVNDFLQGRESRAAVITASHFVRGVVTALSWFNAHMKAFGPDDVDEALRHLGVRDTEIALVKREIQILRKRLGHDGLRSIVAA